MPLGVITSDFVGGCLTLPLSRRDEEKSPVGGESRGGLKVPLKSRPRQPLHMLDLRDDQQVEFLGLECVEQAALSRPASGEIEFQQGSGHIRPDGGIIHLHKLVGFRNVAVPREQDS